MTGPSGQSHAHAAYESIDLPPEYRPTELVYRSVRTFVVRATRLSDRRAVLIKTPQPANLLAVTTELYRKELELRGRFGQGRQSEARIQLVSHQGVPMLVQDDLAMESLAKRLKRGQLIQPLDAVRVARRLVETLVELHAAGLLHGDLHPGNVLWDGGQGVELIDFELSESLVAARGHPAPPLERRGPAMPFLAPEGTGQSDAVRDERSDLYGVGAILFAMLRGAPPFQAGRQLELVHQVLAVRAPPLRETRPEVPEALAAIVARLLQKHPRQRYQSSRGLLSDLWHCERELERTGDVPIFPLGEHDEVLDFRPVSSAPFRSGLLLAQ